MVIKIGIEEPMVESECLSLLDDVTGELRLAAETFALSRYVILGNEGELRDVGRSLRGSRAFARLPSCSHLAWCRDGYGAARYRFEEHRLVRAGWEVDDWRDEMLRASMRNEASLLADVPGSADMRFGRRWVTAIGFPERVAFEHDAWVASMSLAARGDFVPSRLMLEDMAQAHDPVALAYLYSYERWLGIVMISNRVIGDAEDLCRRSAEVAEVWRGNDAFRAWR